MSSSWEDAEADYHIELIKEVTGINVECLAILNEHSFDNGDGSYREFTIAIRFATKEDMNLFKLTFDHFAYDCLIVGKPGTPFSIPM